MGFKLYFSDGTHETCDIPHEVDSDQWSWCDKGVYLSSIEVVTGDQPEAEMYYADFPYILIEFGGTICATEYLDNDDPNFKPGSIDVFPPRGVLGACQYINFAVEPPRMIQVVLEARESPPSQVKWGFSSTTLTFSGQYESFNFTCWGNQYMLAGDKFNCRRDARLKRITQISVTTGNIDGDEMDGTASTVNLVIRFKQGKRFTKCESQPLKTEVHIGVFGPELLYQKNTTKKFSLLEKLTRPFSGKGLDCLDIRLDPMSIRKLELHHRGLDSLGVTSFQVAFHDLSYIYCNVSYVLLENTNVICEQSKFEFGDLVRKKVNNKVVFVKENKNATPKSPSTPNTGNRKKLKQINTKTANRAGADMDTRNGIVIINIFESFNKRCHTPSLRLTDPNLKPFQIGKVDYFGDHLGLCTNMEFESVSSFTVLHYQDDNWIFEGVTLVFDDHSTLDCQMPAAGYVDLYGRSEYECLKDKTGLIDPHFACHSSRCKRVKTITIKTGEELHAGLITASGQVSLSFTTTGGQRCFTGPLDSPHNIAYEVGKVDVFENNLAGISSMFGTCTSYDFTEPIKKATVITKNTLNWVWDYINITFSNNEVFYCRHSRIGSGKNWHEFGDTNGWVNREFCLNGSHAYTEPVQRYKGAAYNKTSCVIE